MRNEAYPVRGIYGAHGGHETAEAQVFHGCVESSRVFRVEY